MACQRWGSVYRDTHADIGSLLPPTAAVGAPVTITGAKLGAPRRQHADLQRRDCDAHKLEFEFDCGPGTAGPTTGNVAGDGEWYR